MTGNQPIFWLAVYTQDDLLQIKKELKPCAF
jgi:hypothetical protein